MAQPVWITPPGNLGTIPEGVFYDLELEAYDPGPLTATSVTGNGTKVTMTFATQTSVPFTVGTSVAIDGFVPVTLNGVYTVTAATTSSVTFANTTTASVTTYGTIAGKIYFEVIAGELPAGIELDNDNGRMIGIPKAIVVLEGVPEAVSRDITSKFAVRAYTKKTAGTITIINRLADRTFSLTVSGENAPEWVTPSGSVGTYFDGSQVLGLQLQYQDNDQPDITVVKLVGGLLPPGLTVSTKGLISGFVKPLSDVGQTAGFSRDGQGFSTYPFDFATKSSSANYEFILEVTDGKTSALRAFTILVYSRNAMTADDTQFTADNTFITADCTPTRVPILLTPEGDIGTYRNDNFFAYKFDGYDGDGDAFEYTISLGGTIGFDTASVNFQPGSFDYANEGFDQGGLQLPPGLQLDPGTGWLYGFIPDLGITELSYNFAIRVYKKFNPTVISGYYFFSMNIIGNVSTQVTWVSPADLGVIDNGAISTLYIEAINTSGIPLQYRLKSGSTSLLPQGLQLLPEGDIAGRVSFDTFALDGGTTTFDVKSTNRANYNSNPTFGISTETTFDLVFTFTAEAYSVNGVVSVFKTFQITVNRAYDEPYNNLYIQAMPPQNDRNLLSSLLQSPDIFPPSLLYRQEDPNFGLSTKVIYQHAYGLTAATQEDYVKALELNHYWKNLVLGEIKTAQATDPVTGKVIYEVVYSEVIDDLVNNEGVSVGKEVTLAYPVQQGGLEPLSVVYPNSLVDMRTQVIDSVGQISNVLPRWMLSKQADGRTLGFTPAWVICYTKPGKSGQIQYNIKTTFGVQLNKIDFKADRYELDRLLSKNWDSVNKHWVPRPPSNTTFDIYSELLYPASSNPTINVSGRIVETVETTQSVAGNTRFGPILVDDTIDQIVVALDDALQAYNTNFTINRGDLHPEVTPLLTEYYIDFVTAPSVGQVIDIYAIKDKYVNNSGSPGNPTPTVFDGNSLQFIAPVDMYSNTQAYDRYLLFPKAEIIRQIPPPDVVGWTNQDGFEVGWVNNDSETVDWTNSI
jgi:hypothetical protein